MSELWVFDRASGDQNPVDWTVVESHPCAQMMPHSVSTENASYEYLLVIRTGTASRAQHFFNIAITSSLWLYIHSRTFLTSIPMTPAFCVNMTKSSFPSQERSPIIDGGSSFLKRVSSECLTKSWKCPTD